ncbi:MAG: hypothetical protein O2890_11690 [Cyanobacteria bacterium]|nr:hypothetical protein [Cyanobacteriota bacterium]MDA0867056.1 hypothetical protein [Cyanobacteriota bacterium]
MDRFFYACFVLLLVLIPFRAGQANEPTVDHHTVEISIGSRVTQGALLDEAEGLVRQIIVNTFGQQSGVSQIEVVVLGERYGEISPILVTTVSRTGWQSEPQVSRWTRYYTESTHALLQRHGDIQPIVTAGAFPPGRPGANIPFREPTSISSQSQVNQENLSDWD